MPKGNPTIEQRLAEAHVAITNVRASAELQAALAAYGYTPERIEQGEQLRDAAKAQYQHKISAYGGLHAAADALSSAERQARTQHRAAKPCSGLHAACYKTLWRNVNSSKSERFMLVPFWRSIAMS